MQERKQARTAEQIPMARMAEEAVIGSIVLLAIARDPFVDLEGRVQDTDFMDENLGTMFKAMKTLHEAGVPIGDIVVLEQELKPWKISSEVSSAVAIVRLCGQVGIAENIGVYADEIRNAAMKRRLIMLAGRISAAAFSPSSEPDTIIAQAESELARLSIETPINSKSIGEFAMDLVQRLREDLNNPQHSVCMTGIPSLDEVMGPLMRRELIIVAARPGLGKTALGMQFAMHAADRGKRVFFASLEMHGEELATRVVCRIADINSRRVRSGQLTEEGIGALECAARSIYEKPVLVWSPPTGTMSQIRGIAKQLHAAGPLSMVVVDYLTKIDAGMDEKRMDREERVGRHAVALRALAKELNVPVVALAQFNRKAEHDEPTMDHLRESGQIEQEANIIIGLHAGKGEDTREPYTVVANILKHRAGMKGKVNLTFNPVQTHYTECVTGPVGEAEATPAPSPRRRVPARNSYLDGFQ